MGGAVIPPGPLCSCTTSVHLVPAFKFFSFIQKIHNHLPLILMSPLTLQIILLPQLPALPPTHNHPFLHLQLLLDPNQDPDPSFSPPHIWSWTWPPASKDISQVASYSLYGKSQELKGLSRSMSLSLCPTSLKLKKRLGSFSSDPSTFIKDLNISLSPMFLPGTISISPYCPPSPLRKRKDCKSCKGLYPCPK